MQPCSYVAPCVLTTIPEDVDLVFLEFNINDNADDKQRERLAERQQQAVEVVDGMDKPSRYPLPLSLSPDLAIPTPLLLVPERSLWSLGKYHTSNSAIPLARLHLQACPPPPFALSPTYEVLLMI